MNKIKKLHIQSLHISGFPYCFRVENSLGFRKITMMTTSLTILLLLKKGHAKFTEDQATYRNPFTLLPKYFSKRHTAEMHQFSQLNTMFHLILPQVLSLICQRLLPNPNLIPNREESGPAFNTTHAHFTISLRCFLKKYEIYLCSNINKIQVHHISDRIRMSNNKAFTPP